MKNETKPSNKPYLILLAACLFITAGLVFGRGVDFGQFLGALTGSLTDANRYKLPVAPISMGQNPTQAVLTGTLTVTTTPSHARYEVLSANTGAIAVPERNGASPLTLPIGNYRVVFKPTANYDTPAEVSTSIALKAPARLNVSYTPWPACTASDWECTAFSACNASTREHTRICVMNNPRCANADSVQPPLSENCDPCGGKKKC